VLITVKHSPIKVEKLPAQARVNQARRYHSSNTSLKASMMNTTAAVGDGTNAINIPEQEEIKRKGKGR
jgi:hypothetical protein